MKKNNLRTPRRRKSGVKALIITLIVVLLIAIGFMVTYAILSRAPEVNTDIPWSKDTNDNVSVKRDAKAYNFLLVGKDNVALNTDVMMLINLNLKNNTVTMMQLPRDTFITLNSTPRKLNSVYSIYYNNSNASDTEGRIRDGMEGLCKVLCDNLAIQIDYYANLNLEALGNIVDAIGGVDMYVPYDLKYSDPLQNLYINIREGQQTLNGDQAQQFVRYRSGYIQADIARQDAQKMFITAFINSFKNKVSITNISPIISTIMDNLTHSLSLNDCVYFAKEAYKIDFSNITMLSAPGTTYTYNGTSYVIMQRSALYNVINTHFNLFDTVIPESSFDKDYNFTLLTNSEINSRYNSTKEFDGEKNADDINKNGIDILLK